MAYWLRSLKTNNLPEENVNNNQSINETIDSNSDDSLTFNSILNKTTENFSNLTITETTSTELINNKMAKLNTDLVFKIIPEFDGNHEHINKFLSLCNFFYKPLVDENDKLLFIEIVKLKLIGQAEKIFKYKQLDDWKSFAAELEVQFSKKESFISLQTKLLNIKQHGNEDIRSYANRIEQLTSELNSACVTMDKDCKVESINSSYSLMAFIGGLSSHDIKIILKCREKLDFKTAVELASREELSYKKPFIPFSSQNTYQSPPNFNPVPIKKEPGVFIRKFCSNCKIPNHDVSECRKLMQSQKSNPRNSLCTFCGKLGHLSHRCYAKYFNSKNSSGSDQYQGQTNRATRSYAQQLPVQFSNTSSSLNQEQYQYCPEAQSDELHSQQMNVNQFPIFPNHQQVDSFPSFNQPSTSKKM